MSKRNRSKREKRLEHLKRVGMLAEQRDEAIAGVANLLKMQPTNNGQIVFSNGGDTPDIILPATAVTHIARSVRNMQTDYKVLQDDFESERRWADYYSDHCRLLGDRLQLAKNALERLKKYVAENPNGDELGTHLEAVSTCLRGNINEERKPLEAERALRQMDMSRG